MFGGLDLKSLKFENLYRAYLNLDSRQQTIALVAAILAVVLVIILPIAAASGRLSKLEVQLETAKDQMRSVMMEIEKYNEIKQQWAGIESQFGLGFDSAISTTLESLASKNNINDKIDSLKERPPVPSELMEEISVDVRLKKVRLADLVAFLYDIEHNPGKLLKLKKLEIKPRYDNKQDLDCTFQVSTYRLVQPETKEK